MTKVITTKLTSSVASTPLISPVVDSNSDTTVKPELTQFNNSSNVLIESYLPIVESSGVSTHIYDILTDKYGIVSRDKGLAIEALNRWVCIQFNKLQSSDQEVLRNVDTNSMYYLAGVLVTDYLTVKEARSGILFGSDPRSTFNLHLIGESNHAKTTRCG